MTFNLNFEYIGLIYVFVTFCLWIAKRFKWIDNTNDFLQFNNLLIGLFSLISFILFYSNFYYTDLQEYFAFHQRTFGQLYYIYIIFIITNMLLPLIFLIKRFRKNHWNSLMVSLFILLPIFYERYLVYLITSMHEDYLPSSWSYSFDVLNLLWTIGIYTLCWLGFPFFKKKHM